MAVPVEDQCVEVKPIQWVPFELEKIFILEGAGLDATQTSLIQSKNVKTKEELVSELRLFDAQLRAEMVFKESSKARAEAEKAGRGDRSHLVNDNADWNLDNNESGGWTQKEVRKP